MYKILGIGNALVDVMTLIPDDSVLGRFALPKGSMQLVDRDKSEYIKAETSKLDRNLSSGGSAANTIHGLAMLGAETAFIGSIGKDDTGDFFENDMKKAGIHTILSRRDSPTGTAVALISTDSERTFATHLGAAIELVADDLNDSDFKGYDILYLEGYLITNMPLVEKACQLAKAEGMQIVLDLASYNVVESNRSGFRQIIEKYVDILFANEEEAKAYTGQGPEGALNSLSASCGIVVIKAGSEGSWIKQGSEIFRIAANKVNVKDTTGAGDLYAAGFLYGYAGKRNPRVCGRWGSLIAGRVIQIVGARLSNESWKEIRGSISRTG